MDHAYARFEKFAITPRLHLKSATFGEGKTTLFDVLEKLVCNPERDDSITAAMVASRANAPPPPTFLLDEADNLGLMSDPLFRAILNSGYKSTGQRSVMGPKRQWIRQRTFAPMALASIRNLPGPLMRRSVIIEMRRAPKHIRAALWDFDDADPVQKELFATIYSALRWWAWHCQVNRSPDMPERLPTLPRQAWRPLVAVGDSCSEAVGRLVREVAVTMGGYADEPRLVALGHLYEIFSMGLSDLLVPPKEHHAAINVEGRQLTSETIVQNLRAMDGMWDGWAGEDGRGTPHGITAGELARLLRDWWVRPRTLWSPGPKDRRVSAKGYLRADFEELWHDYEISAVTPSHAAKIVVSERPRMDQGNGTSG